MAMQHQQAQSFERPSDESQATIRRLKEEIMRLNDELTCASEAHQAISSENSRLQAALANAADVFSAAGDTEMAESLKSELNGGRRKQPAISPPASRKVFQG
jgi:chromosome segregation ATPase